MQIYNEVKPPPAHIADECKYLSQRCQTRSVAKLDPVDGYRLIDAVH